MSVMNTVSESLELASSSATSCLSGLARHFHFPLHQTKVIVPSLHILMFLNLDSMLVIPLMEDNYSSQTSEAWCSHGHSEFAHKLYHNDLSCTCLSLWCNLHTLAASSLVALT